MSWGCCDEVPQTGWLRMTETYPHRSRGQTTGAKEPTGPSLLRPWVGSFLPRPARGAAGDSWRVSLRLHPSSLCLPGSVVFLPVCVSPSLVPRYKDPSRAGLWLFLLQHMTSSPLPPKALFPKKVLRLRRQHVFLWDTVQPVTEAKPGKAVMTKTGR